MPWIAVCGADEIEPEEGRRFDHAGRTYAVFRNHEDRYYCVDGLCTHEDVHLAGGLVMENTVACPKHGSVFDFTTGDVDTPPACENLRSYPTRVADVRIEIEV
jgi:3-phenylpropionate/trans-cinnamate dioxygenase ferredoxin subunit